MQQKNYQTLYQKVAFTVTFICILFYWTDRFIPLQPFLAIEAKTYDWRVLIGKKIPEDPRLIYIAVDKQNYADLIPEDQKKNKASKILSESWPWSREIWGLTIERLVGAGATIVALDFEFKSEREGDDAFHRALLKNSDSVVLGMNIQVDSYSNEFYKEDPNYNKSNQNQETISFPNPNILGDFSSPESRPLWDSVGYFNYWADQDGVIRRSIYHRNNSLNEPISSLSAKILEKISKNSPFFPLPHEVYFRFTYNPQFQNEINTDHDYTFRPIPIYQIFDEKIWERNFNSGAFFKDKIILIGPLGNWGHDYHKTSYPLPMPGPKIHLNTLNAAMQKAFLYPTSPLADLLTIFISGVMAYGLLCSSRSPRMRILLLLGLNLVFLLIAYLFFNYLNLVILCFIPTLAFNGSVFFCNIYEIIEEQKERARFRSHLERYVSKNVVRMLLENPEKLQGRKTVSILFSDLRGFTTLTESADPEALVKQLNEYLTKMVKCVFQNNGTLDKFIGDAVMAIWGNAETEGPEIDAQRAVQCALDMIEELRGLNLKWKLEGKPELQVGIGINHGQAIVGDMGSDDKAHERMEFTVIGDSVNTASRIEGLTKEYHTELLLGESVAPLVEKQFQLRSVALVQMKGKTKPTEIFGVLERIDPLYPKSKKQWLVTYEKAIQLYRHREFKAALETFRAADQEKADDYLIHEYIESCEHFIQTPPDENWTGVIVMKTK